MARNPDPQFTTQGAYRQLDESVARYGPMEGPNEGQRGIAMAAAPPRQKARRKTVRARRGEDETGRKTRTGEKIKNAGQLRSPAQRKARQMGPIGRARAGIGKRPRGKTRTAAAGRAGGSPKARRRKANRGTLRRA